MLPEQHPHPHPHPHPQHQHQEHSKHLNRTNSNQKPNNNTHKKSPSSLFFSPPIQRQKWGDTQIRPHVNWGDLFFDLFYVAAAYNLAAILKTDPTYKGFFYFLSLFGSIFATFWQTKMIHDSRFEVPDDILHRTLEILQLCALATSVLHIRPVGYMSHGAEHPEMFLYCLGLVIGSLIHIVLLCEIRWVWVVGQEEVARRAVGRDLRHQLYSFGLQCSAMVYAALVYYGKIGKDVLGEEEHHLPAILLLVHWITKPIAMYLLYVVFSAKGGRDFKSKSVPMNIDFAIHRYGEWTMLMLGESILSLLIVNDISRKNEAEYYFTFYLGIVSVTLIQFLYFKSQPHDADHHALRRTKTSGFIFTIWLQVYSAALIVVGTSYKMLLLEYTSEYANEQSNVVKKVGNSVVGDGDDGGGGGGGDEQSRVLYGATKYYFTTQERRQRIANLYCFGLAFVFLSLDLMNVAHTGLKISTTRCHNPVDGKFRIKALILVVMSRVVILAFVVTLSQYVTDPEYVALIGFGTILMQVGVRFLGRRYFPSEFLHDLEEEEFHPDFIEEEKCPQWENSPRI